MGLAHFYCQRGFTIDMITVSIGVPAVITVIVPITVVNVPVTDMFLLNDRYVDAGIVCSGVSALWLVHEE